MSKKLTTLVCDDRELPVTFVERQEVKEGVICDIYTITGDATKDLAVIEIQPGFRSPRQRVLKGTHTIQRFTSGTANLFVDELDGSEHTRFFTSEEATQDNDIEVKVGEIMQWSSLGPDPLVYYEICEPPFETGRFEDLPEESTVHRTHKTHQELLTELTRSKDLVTVGAWYSHYKHPKDLYLVTGFTFLESTDEIAVLYTPKRRRELCFARPLSSWLEKIEQDGRVVSRFSLVE